MVLPDIINGPELYYTLVEDQNRAKTMIMRTIKISGTEMSVVEAPLSVVQ